MTDPDPSTDGGGTLIVRYQLTPADYRKAIVEVGQQSIPTVAVGTALAAQGGWLAVNDNPSGVVLLLLGLSLATGVAGILFISLAVRRRPDLLLSPQEVRIDADAVTIATASVSTRQEWSTFKRIRELTNVILLDYGTGANAMLPLRAFDTAALQRFRGLARTRWSRPARWAGIVNGVLLGLVGAVVWYLAILFVVTVTT